MYQSTCVASCNCVQKKLSVNYVNKHIDIEIIKILSSVFLTTYYGLHAQTEGKFL